MYRLFDSRLSGNAWKVRLLMRELQTPFERVTLDLAAGEARSESFSHISRFQRVPVLELDDGRHLVESGAILLFLAEGSDFLPADPIERAEVTSWLFYEQADLCRPLARARFFHLRGIADKMRDELPKLHEAGYLALEKVEAWLGGRLWLANDRFSIADIAVFPYVALASIGGFEMNRFKNISAWLERLERRPAWEPLVPADA